MVVTVTGDISQSCALCRYFHRMRAIMANCGRDKKGNPPSSLPAPTSGMVKLSIKYDYKLFLFNVRFFQGVSSAYNRKQTTI